jgi:hypothetical protein
MLELVAWYQKVVNFRDEMYLRLIFENRSMSLIVSFICKNSSMLNALYTVECHIGNTDDKNLGYYSTV